MELREKLINTLFVFFTDNIMYHLGLWMCMSKYDEIFKKFYYFILLRLFYFEVVSLCRGSKSEKKILIWQFHYITNQLSEYMIQIYPLDPISMTSLLWINEVLDQTSWLVQVLIMPLFYDWFPFSPLSHTCCLGRKGVLYWHCDNDLLWGWAFTIIKEYIYIISMLSTAGILSLQIFLYFPFPRKFT